MFMVCYHQSDFQATDNSVISSNELVNVVNSMESKSQS